MMAWRATAAIVLACAAGTGLAWQPAPPFPGTLDEHPAIRYETRPSTDAVASLDAELGSGRRTLSPDDRSGYLLPVLRALDIPVESQLLVFSKTGLQRAHTGPSNPRALYFNGSVVVGFIPGAAALEIASHDPQQGVMFYTLDQAAPQGRARFTRRTECLTCHLATVTLEIPGFIARSNFVGADGQVLPALGHHVVNHTTPHTERWGGWFVTGHAIAPPYGPLGHLGNITVTSYTTAGPAIFSDRVLVDWLNRPKAGDPYPSSDSDLAALMTFDHQMHGMNLITRLNWEARIAEAESPNARSDAAVQRHVHELADYLLFTGEAPLPFEVTPRPGLAEALRARAPADAKGRSCAELDLKRRLMHYPCSYLVYSAAFTGLPPATRADVLARMRAILGDPSPRYQHLTVTDRLNVAELLPRTY